jgi:hypothetical protein
MAKLTRAKNAGNPDHAIAERRWKVSQLYLQGLPQHRIGEQVGVSQKCVSEDLAAVRAEWLAKSVDGFGERLAEELAKVDRVEAVAWDSFERSRASITVGKGADGKPMKVERPGDDRFLGRVSWCIETRAKLLGLVKTDKASSTVVMVNWADLTGGGLGPNEDKVERLLAAAEGRDALPPRVVAAEPAEGK